MDTSNPTKDKKKAPVVDIQQELQATSFGKQRSQEVTNYTPGKLLNLTIDKVHTYDRNPRREDNPEHEQIKSSIRHRGMDQVLSVTQRPDDPSDEFMIIHGGNTRLEILKELYEETNDQKFGSLQCKYVAWQSESDAIIGHLIENDARGDYSFIDRAIGVRHAKEELEQESNDQLSSRLLLSKLKEQGYKLSRPDLFRMNFAVDILYPAMPIAMDSGVGPRQIDAIKKLRKHTKDMFEETHGVSDASEAEWSQKFHDALSKHNANDWSYEELYSDILLQLADNNVAEANRLSFILSSRLEGFESQKPKPETHIETNDNEVPEIITDPTDTHSIPNTEDDQTKKNDDNTVEINPETDQAEPKNILSNDAISDSPKSDFVNPTIIEEQTTQPLSTTPKDLRSKLFTQALQLASNNGFGELVTPLPSLGSGFIIKDLLSESYMKGEKLFGTIKKRPYKERIMVWWMLFGFSELRMMALHQTDIIQPVMPEGDLKNILLSSHSEQDQRRLVLAHIFHRTGEFIIDDLSIYFWAVASDKNIAQIQAMQKLYRQLNEVLGFNLWESKK